MAEKVRKIEEMSEVEEPGQTAIKTGQGNRKKNLKPDRSSEPDWPVQLDRLHLKSPPLHTLFLSLLRLPSTRNPETPIPIPANPEPSSSPLSMPIHLARFLLSLPRHHSLSSSTPTSQPTEFLKPLHPLPTVFSKNRNPPTHSTTVNHAATTTYPSSLASISSIHDTHEIDGQEITKASGI